MNAVAETLRRQELDAAQRVFRIQKTRVRWRTELAEIWQYRELLFFLVWRDVKVRYKQTFLGATWAILQPLLSMVILAVIFGKFAGFKGEYKVPYPLFLYAGLLPWTYFAACLTSSSTSIVGSASLVTKVYFPRLIVPLASIVVPVIDFLFAFAVLVALFLWYGRTPHWHSLVGIPFFLGMALFTAFGVGLWLSALNVRYRDVRYAVPFLTQFWLYATPAIYLGLSQIPEDWQLVVAINPMNGVIDGFRWAVLGRGIPRYDIFLASGLVALVLVLGGLYYFRRVERNIADVI